MAAWRCSKATISGTLLHCHEKVQIGLEGAAQQKLDEIVIPPLHAHSAASIHQAVGGIAERRAAATPRRDFLEVDDFGRILHGFGIPLPVPWSLPSVSYAESLEGARGTKMLTFCMDGSPWQDSRGGQPRATGMAA